MSIEALAFAKITDLGAAESPAARLLFYVIAENTFNDSLMCRVGQAELVYQTRGAMRTMQRHLSALVNAGIITVSRSGGVGAGRLPDAITIVGFGDWLAHERARHSRPPRVGPQHIERQHAKMASCQKAPKQASKPASTARAKPCANPVNREGGQSAILRGGNPPIGGGHIKTRTRDPVQVSPPTPCGGAGVGGGTKFGEGEGPTAEPGSISDATRAQARQLAPGWDIDVLIAEWRQWSAGKGDTVRDPGAAFLAFARQRGPHKSVAGRAVRRRASVQSPDFVALPGEIAIHRLGPEWQAWLDHVDAHDRVAGQHMRSAFCAFVTSLWPRQGSPLPRIPGLEPRVPGSCEANR